MFEKIKSWFKELGFMLIHTPNSPKGLRHRAERLAKKGVRLEHPYLSVLVKQALLKEHKGDQIPDPKVWDKMTPMERRKWVQRHLEGETTEK